MQSGTKSFVPLCDFLGILQPRFKLIQGNDLPVAVLLSSLGCFVPDGELLLCNFPSLDPGEAALVFPAVFLKDLVAPAALRPLPDGGCAPAELPGRAGAAAILRRDPSGDGEVPPAVSTVPSRISRLTHSRREKSIKSRIVLGYRISPQPCARNTADAKAESRCVARRVLPTSASCGRCARRLRW